MIVSFERVGGGRNNLQIPPAAMRRKGRDSLDRRLGYCSDVCAKCLDVRYRPFPVIQQSRTGRTWPFLNRQRCNRPLARSTARVLVMARKHEVVEDQRIGAGPK